MKTHLCGCTVLAAVLLAASALPADMVTRRYGKLILSPPPGTTQPAATAKAEAVKVLPAANGAGVVRFDLSPLPAGAKILRADLLITRTQAVTGADDEAMVDIEIFPLFADFAGGGEAPSGGAALQVRPPWFDSFDASEAVRQWTGGKTNGGFFVKACPFIDLPATCLDVAYEGKPDGGTGLKPVPAQAAGIQAFHRAGQTFVTWKEIEDPVGADEIRWGQLRNILDSPDRAGRVRYCLYRSDKPITAGNLQEAERIAAVGPLSGWNLNGRSVDRAIDAALGTQYYLQHHQWNPFVQASMDGKWGVDCPMERLVIRDGDKPLPRGTGLYVHTPGKAGRAYYAVVASIDGVENTADISDANSLTTAVDEVAGEGEPVLQKEFPPKPYFNYREQRLHYVNWVAPPYCNVPSQYYNWSVGVPERPAPPVTTSPGSRPASKGMPIELSLHRDGRSYDRTQYRLEQDSLVISPHDFPIKTWWYGYHESLGTLTSFRQGAVQNYTERRLLAFIEWAARKWAADRGRILVTGAGGGASGGGALHLAIRHPEVFCLAESGYGWADYAGELAELVKIKRAGNTPAQLESIWGKVAWNLKTPDGKGVWDEQNLTKVVAGLPDKVHLPLVTVTGGGMMKPMRDFFVAMIEKGQPFMCRYGVYGGGTLLPVSTTGTWTGMIRQEVRKDRPLPAFWGQDAAGLWENPKEPAGELVVSDGIKRWWGEINTGFRWKTDDIVDEPARTEITVYWGGSARQRRPGGTVTLRRVQNFRVRPDWQYHFEIRSAAGQLLREGPIAPLADGAFVFKDFSIPPEGVRLIVKP